MSDLPRCIVCGEEMTPQNAKIHPEYFYHDDCLPDELKPKPKPVAKTGHKYFSFDPTVEEREQKFPEFICSLSPIVRAAANVAENHDKIREIVKGVVWQIDQEEVGVAESLKGISPLKGTGSARQVDIRTEAGGGGEIVFKCFVIWEQKHYNCWQVFVEGVHETHWEEFLGMHNPSDN